MSNIVIGKHTLESLTSGMYSDPFVVHCPWLRGRPGRASGAGLPLPVSPACARSCPTLNLRKRTMNPRKAGRNLPK